MTPSTILRLSAVALLCVGCGGSGGYGGGGTPSAPSGPPASNVVTITITGTKGALSFSPNPAICPAGQMVAWKNADSVVHRVVIDDLNVNTGDIAPGATSQPMALGAVSKGYRCALHPEMVGALNGASNPSPGGGDGPCGPYGC